MRLLVGQDLLEEVRGRRVFLLAAHDDAGLQPGHHFVLDREVGLELFSHSLAHPQRKQPLVIRQSVENQYAVGDLLGVLHFIEGLGTRMGGQFGESPVLLHLGMQEILVDGREFARQLLIEQFQNVGIALHARSLAPCCVVEVCGLSCRVPI